MLVDARLVDKWLQKNQHLFTDSRYNVIISRYNLRQQLLVGNIPKNPGAINLGRLKVKSLNNKEEFVKMNDSHKYASD